MRLLQRANVIVSTARTAALRTRLAFAPLSAHASKMFALSPLGPEFGGTCIGVAVRRCGKPQIPELSREPGSKGGAPGFVSQPDRPQIEERVEG